MAKQKTQATKSVWKGKQWYEIVSPKIFGSKVLSETPSSDPKHLVGRTLNSSVALLTGNPTKYYFKMRFKISDISGSKLNTTYYGHDCSRDFMSRMVRRGSTRIDTRDIMTTKDGQKIVVKTVAVTIRNVLTKVKNTLREEISNSMKAKVSELTLDDFLKDMISGKLQKSVRLEVSKIYPVRELEIRKTEIVE